MSSQPLINASTRLRVSSVLNKDTRAYGKQFLAKQFLADGKEETCWNSDACAEGGSQWLVVNLESPAVLESVEFKFQGGFASSQVAVEALRSGQFKLVHSLYPEDVNSGQASVPVDARWAD